MLNHGTVHTYCNLRCRCTECRSAQARYMAAYRDRKRKAAGSTPATEPIGATLTGREKARARAAYAT